MSKDKRNIRSRSVSGNGGQHGFTSGEFIVLLIIVVALMAGIVWLVGRTVEFLSSGKAYSVLESDADRLMDDLQKLIGQARILQENKRSDNGQHVYAEVDFLSDLDGDPKTGGYSLGETKGLERTVIRRKGQGKLLMAEVYDQPGYPPALVELSELLKRGDPDSFLIEFDLAKGEPGKDGVTEATVYLKMEKEGESISSERSFRLKYSPCLEMSE